VSEYNAKAIRVLDLDANDGKTVYENRIYIIQTNCPSVGYGRMMLEDYAKEKYGITDLQIDETKAVTFSGDRDENIIIVDIGG
jgi:activator of 2-hydroxyglutaryl-CoA dehydratase